MDQNLTPGQKQEIIDQTEKVLESLRNWEAIDRANTVQIIVDYLGSKVVAPKCHFCGQEIPSDLKS